jgi:hypothetical protein
MNMLTDLIDHVIGVDPDRDRVTAAIVDSCTQGELARVEFAANPGGYRALIEWADDYSTGDARVWSIEGAGSYGAGLAATLSEAGEWVIEFDRPSTRPTRDGSTSDGLDAVRAASGLLGREKWARPRVRGALEARRVSLVARNGAQRSHIAAINQMVCRSGLLSDPGGQLVAVPGVRTALWFRAASAPSWPCQARHTPSADFADMAVQLSESS